MNPGISPIYIDPQGVHTNRPPVANDPGWALAANPTQVQPVNANPNQPQTVTVKATELTRQTLFPPHDIPEAERQATDTNAQLYEEGGRPLPQNVETEEQKKAREEQEKKRLEEEKKKKEEHKK
jgi:hypothetical protein